MTGVGRAASLAAGLLLVVAASGCDRAAPPPVPEVGTGAATDTEPKRPGAGSPFPVTIEDDAGRHVLLEEPPRRIVSLVPGATRVLLALGAGDRLVGRTEFDRDPELADLPSVGGGLEPSMERLVALQPDLVVRFRAESDPATPRRLDQARIPHLAIRPDRIEDVLRMLGILGRAVGEPERADDLRDATARELGEVADRVEGVDRPRGAYLLGGDPPLAAGGGTFLHELMELAGADNVLADVVELYAPVSVEDLVSRELDILFVTEGADIPAGLRVVPVVRVPREVESPGLEMGASARRLARELHPDRFR